MDLSGKVVLITGSSRGIGRSIALEFAKAGATVAINYRVDIEGAQETLNIIKNLDGFGSLFQADVSDYKDSEKMIKDIYKNFGKIDILVNNAGISKVGLFIDSNELDWDNIMNTNIKGVYNCCHNVLKYMLPEKSGNIINISSIWGNVGASCEVIYSASKGAVNSFTKALAKELGPSSIRVNAIAPGVIDTDMNSWLTIEERKALEEEISLMKLGDGEDIGKIAVYLASKDSKYITGQVITVDGGMF